MAVYPASTASGSLRRAFLLTALIKLALAALFPLTGDEAYFIQWGRQLAGSYYDHGPITGWVIWTTLLAGDSLFVIRLPAVVTSLGIAWLIWRTLRPQDPAKAAAITTLFLWSPVNVLSVLMTTDTPLMALSGLAAVAAARGHRTDRPLDYLLAGALLGLAFLSKYFAVVLGFALAVAWIGFARPRRWAAVGWLLLGVLPFAAQHVYWNYHNAWVTVSFNLFNRHADSEFSLLSPLGYLALLAYLFGPGILWVLLRPRPGDRRSWRELPAALGQSPDWLLVMVFVVPLGVFAVVSFVHAVGVHWVLSFYPFGYVLLFHLCEPGGLQRARRAMIVFTGAHVLLAMVLLAVPVEVAQRHRSYLSIVVSRHPDEVRRALEPYLDRYLLATPSYAKSALFDFFVPAHVPVVGPGSYHGRQDDLLTDFRALDGRDILIATNKRSELESAAAWFERTELREIDVRGAKLQVLLGDGFRYEAYREEVLKPVAERYYQLPSWLAPFSDRSFFRERYRLERPTSS